MQLKKRVNLLISLGEYLQQESAPLESAIERAELQNPWFTKEFIRLSVGNIATSFLQEDLLERWVNSYAITAKSKYEEKTVGIVMAGNIPMVGFHDLLCVFAAGHKAVVKLSAKDEVLLRHGVQKLIEWDPEVAAYVTFAENLKGCDAYIATGSNNTSRYFEYYFSKYPSLIRKNRTSVAVLDGTETSEELSHLSDDILQYFGLGCRNVTKIYVPEQYDFIPLLTAVKKYQHFLDFHKYKHNYDYQLALLIMNSKIYMTSEPLLFVENESFYSPVSLVHYNYYSSVSRVKEELENREEIQCVVGHGFIPFGMAQSPALTDYADGVDTMQFLAGLR